MATTKTSKKTAPKMKGLGKKTEAVTKPKVKAKAKTSPKDLILASSYEVENLTKASAIKLAPELIDSSGMNDFKLGGVLLKIQEEKWWDDDKQNYESFKDYIECGLGMAYRKSMYLINIFEKLVEAGVKWSQVRSIGWSKLRFIVDLINKDNVDEWVERANSMNSLEIQSYIQAMKASESSGGDEPALEVTKVSTITFKVHPDQKEIIKEAISKKKEEVGTKFDAVALEHMAIDIVEGKLGKPKAAKVTKSNVVKYLKDLGAEAAGELIVDLYPELAE